MKSKMNLLIVLLILTISLNSCETFLKSVPMADCPDLPHYEGSISYMFVQSAIDSIQTRIQIEANKYQNGDYTYKEYCEKIEPLYSKLLEMKKEADKLE